MNQCPSADVETKHYSLTWSFSPGRWVLLRSSKDAGCHFVPPHGLLCGLVEAQGEVGAAAGRTQHPVDRKPLQPVPAPSSPPSTSLQPARWAPARIPSWHCYLHCSSVAVTKIKHSHAPLVPLVPSSITPRVAPTTVSQIKKKKITMQACQIPAFLRAPWEG